MDEKASRVFVAISLKKFGGGVLIPLFWTSGDVSSGFQGLSGQPYPCDSPQMQHLPTSWQSSRSLPCTLKQTLVGLRTRIYPAATASQCETRQTLYRPSSAGSAVFVAIMIAWNIIIRISNSRLNIVTKKNLSYFAELSRKH